MARILIVEDSPTHRLELQKAVGALGYETVVADNGRAGVDMAYATHPDLILMDVVMPIMDGYEATRELKRDARTMDIPIIMVTTKDQRVDKVWGARQGAIDYLTKPINADQLKRAIHAQLETASFPRSA